MEQAVFLKEGLIKANKLVLEKKEGFEVLVENHIFEVLTGK